jgi:hypothetical protein
MDQRGHSRDDQLAPDPDCAAAMLRPAHAERARMFEKQAIDDAAFGFGLVGRHGPCS